MAAATTPDRRPANPNFSSGPCAKRPGFTLDALSGAFLGRRNSSDRSAGPRYSLASTMTTGASHDLPWTCKSYL